MKEEKSPIPVTPDLTNKLKSKLRVIEDWPRKGVRFIDITTALNDPGSFKSIVDIMTDFFSNKMVEGLVGIEARGLMIGAPVAYNLGVGFVPARKRGKLPSSKMSMEYTLEYSSELLEVHEDAIKKGQRIAIVDDLLATGGTSEATVRLVEKLGGTVVGIAYLVELDFLKGRDRLSEYEILSIVHYDS